MEIKEIAERLREIAAKSPMKQTREDRAFVKEQAKEYGVTIKRAGCRDCYTDAAVAIYAKIKEADGAAVTADIEPWKRTEYELRAGIDVYWCGERVNAATATAENVARWIATGMPMNYFTPIAAE